MNDLDKALLYWEAGEQLPLDLAVSLMSEGFDVEALEAIHLVD